MVAALDSRGLPSRAGLRHARVVAFFDFLLLPFAAPVLTSRLARGLLRGYYALHCPCHPLPSLWAGALMPQSKLGYPGNSLSRLLLLPPHNHTDEAGGRPALDYNSSPKEPMAPPTTTPADAGLRRLLDAMAYPGLAAFSLDGTCWCERGLCVFWFGKYPSL